MHQKIKFGKQGRKSCCFCLVAWHSQQRPQDWCRWAASRWGSSSRAQREVTRASVRACARESLCELRVRAVVTLWPHYGHYIGHSKKQQRDRRTPLATKNVRWAVVIEPFWISRPNTILDDWSLDALQRQERTRLCELQQTSEWCRNELSFSSINTSKKIRTLAQVCGWCNQKRTLPCGDIWLVDHGDFYVRYCLWRRLIHRCFLVHFIHTPFCGSVHTLIGFRMGKFLCVSVFLESVRFHCSHPSKRFFGKPLAQPKHLLEPTCKASAYQEKHTKILKNR